MKKITIFIIIMILTFILVSCQSEKNNNKIKENIHTSKKMQEEGETKIKENTVEITEEENTSDLLDKMHSLDNMVKELTSDETYKEKSLDEKKIIMENLLISREGKEIKPESIDFHETKYESYFTIIYNTEDDVSEMIIIKEKPQNIK